VCFDDNTRRFLEVHNNGHNMRLGCFMLLESERCD